MLPAEDRSPHHILCESGESIFEIISQGWDLLVVHPPCTFLTLSAAWAFTDGPYHQKVKPGTLTGLARRNARDEAIKFTDRLWNSPINKIAIENPRGFLGTMWKPFTQVIQPYEFGDDASKGTCLWLKGLPKLVGRKYVEPRLAEWPKGSGKFVKRWANQTDSGQNNLTPSEDRWKARSKTYQGIADAMAKQWGSRNFDEFVLTPV